MAVNEKEIEKMCKNYFLNEQTDEAKAKLLYESKVYPNYSAMQDLPLQYPGIQYSEGLDDIQRKNQEIKQSDDQSDTKLDKKINNLKIRRHKYKIDSETEQNLHLTIANNTFQMRLKLLSMETNILHTYYVKNLIENEIDTWTNIQNLDTCIGIAYTALKTNSFEKAEKELLIAENLSMALMTKIEEMVHTKAAVKYVQNPEVDIEVPNCRSIVNVRDTKEDATNCILKVTDTLEIGKCDHADNFVNSERQLHKTKRFNLSIDIEKNISQDIAIANNIMAEKPKKTIEKRNREHKLAEDYHCKTAKTYNADESGRVERNLNDAKTFYPSLDLELLASKNSIEEMPTIKMSDHPIINTTYGGQPYSLEKSKNETELRVKNNLDTDNSNKDDKREASNKYKLLDSRNFEQTNIVGKFEPESSELNDYFSKHNAVSKTIKPPQKKQAEYFISKQVKTDTDLIITAPQWHKNQVNKTKPTAEKTICDENFDDAINICNKGEEQYLTARSKELLKKKCEILSSSETTRNEPDKEVKNETSNGIKSQDVDESVNQENTFRSNGKFKKINCYELPIEATKLNEIGALQCIEKAEDAFQNGQYDRAEHFLLKSLRLFDNQKAKSFLETIRYAKAQNNTGVTVKTDVNYNEHVTDHLLNDNHIEYDKCIDVAKKVIVIDVNDHSQNENIKENNECLIELTTKPVAERNQEKVEPNNDIQKQHIPDVRGSKPSRDEGNVSKTVNGCDDLKQEKEAKLFLSLAIEAKSVHSYVAARHYLQRALERQPNVNVKIMIKNIQKDLGNGRHSLSESEIKSEAKKLLIKVDDFIYMGNFDNAEILLIVSWDMHRSPSTTLYHKKFIRTRMDLYKTQKKSCLDGTNRIDRISENIFKCDELVYSALTNYENKKFEEAEVLLKKASNVYPCVRITKLLAEIEQAKNTLFQKFKRTWM